MQQLKIDIIGRGRVASHLLTAFSGKADGALVNPHSLEELRADSDFILISVSDSAIGEIVAKLHDVKGVVAHTSGSTPVEIFENNKNVKKYGVFYPLQTFTKGKRLEYSAIPFFIEGNDPATEDSLIKLASMVSDNVRRADSLKRQKLHVAAVFACNFTNHLWTLAGEYLSEAGMDFNDLLPLIQETVDKVKLIPPRDAQTGPAVRNDTVTISSHLEELKHNSELKNIYMLLSDSIRKRNKTI